SRAPRAAGTREGLAAVGGSIVHGRSLPRCAAPARPRRRRVMLARAAPGRPSAHERRMARRPSEEKGGARARAAQARVPPPGRPSRGSALLALAIAAATLAAYSPSYAYDAARHEGFVWDDDDHFLADPLVRADDGWWRVWLDPRPGVVGVEGGAAVWNYWP